MIAVTVCGEQGRFPTTTGGGGSTGDTENPVASVVFPGGAADTIVDITDSLKFTVKVTDNIRIASVKVQVTGLNSFPIDTTVLDSSPAGTVTSLTRDFAMALPTNAAGQRLQINVTAQDGSSNVGTASANVTIDDRQPPKITVLAPTSGVTAPNGGTLIVLAKSTDPSGIARMGARLYFLNALQQPIAIAGDSTPAGKTNGAGIYTQRLTTRQDTFRVVIPDTLAPGTYPVQVFAVDSSANANRGTSADISITVADTLKPFGSFILPLRNSQVNAGDSVIVRFRGQDKTGVASVMFDGVLHTGVDSLGTGVQVPRFNTVTVSFPSKKTDTTITRVLSTLSSDSTPGTVFLRATLKDGSGNTATVVDTITIVPGRFAIVTSPANGSFQAIGAGLPVSVAAQAPDSLIALGYYLKRSPTLMRDSLPILPRLIGTTSTFLLPARLRSDTGQLAIGSLDSIIPFAYGKTSGYFEGSPAVIVNVGARITVTAPATVIAGDSLRVTSVRAQDSHLQKGITSVTLYVQAIRSPGHISCTGCADTIPRYGDRSGGQPLVLNLSARLPVDTTLSCFLFPVLSDSTAEAAQLVVEVLDRAGALTRTTTPITILAGPSVSLTAPATGTRKPIGIALSVAVTGFDTSGVTALGFVSQGAVRDSQTFVVSPTASRPSHTFTLAVAATAPLSSDTITPFAVGTLHRQFNGKSAVVSFADTVPPTDTIKTPTSGVLLAVGDSVLMTVRVLDNRGVTSLALTGVAYRGSRALGTDTAVARFTTRSVTLSQKTDTTITRYVRALLTDSTPETVYLIAQVQDTAGNTRRDSISLQIVNGPKVAILGPADSSLTSPGHSITIQVQAISRQGVKILGWSVSGAVTARDSTIANPVAGNLADTLIFSSSLAVPGGTPNGTITVTGFAKDSLGNQSGVVNARSILVQTTGTDVTPPLVQFTIGTRVEAGDTITVHATDPSGITRVGFIARNVTTGTVIRGDSLNFAGNLTDISRKLSLSLDTISTFARQVTVEAFALDGATPANRGVSTLSVPKTTPAAQETLTVVAGKTIALPLLGSQIGDAIYDSTRQELYLTNTSKDRIEVFSLASNSFVASIPVGSRPVGIALWPADTLGGYMDTVIVANTGGTNLSIVDVRPGVRMEVARQRLPAYTLFTVKTTTNSGGGTDVIFTSYGFSSRPFQLGATCITSVNNLATCDIVRAVYSTTPTPAQPVPFVNRGHLAWIDLSGRANPGPHEHFIYEHTSDIERDTIQIEAAFDSLPGQPLREIVLGAGLGVRTHIEDLSFQDSTFVRNSGDFRHVIIGEGGPAGFARALTYDARRGLGQHATLGTGSCVVGGVVLDCTSTVDTAVSSVEFVGNFVINRASRVSGVATNFNGRTNLVRADSIYAFDFILRQTGLMQISGQAVGMDFPRANNFDAETRGTGGIGGNLSPNNRLVFAARPDSSIDVFDTYFYGEVQDQSAGGAIIPIPIRNALIGPVRVATVAGKTVLFGITAKGLVVVQLPSITNSLFPRPPLRTSFDGPTGAPGQTQPRAP